MKKIILLIGIIMLAAFYLTSVSAIISSGGVKTFDGDAVLHNFTSNGTFTIDTPVTAEVLVVAGGAGGAALFGGGGAGGLLNNKSFLIPNGTYAVTVGGGGDGGIATGDNPNPGQNGGNSVFYTLTAIGGGGGTANTNGNTGGSGGGGGGWGGVGYNGGLATLGQGQTGGDVLTINRGGGGGGGCVQAGEIAQTNRGGNGGNGCQVNITGSLKYYAAGGGAGGYSTAITFASTGGLGGGGIGPAYFGNGTDATGYGSGGGAGSRAGEFVGGGAGSDGIVIIRYTNILPETTITLLYPTNNQFTSKDPVPINYTIVSENPIDTIQLFINGTLNKTVSGNQNTTIDIGEGTFFLNVSANNTNGTIGYDTALFTVDRTNPFDNLLVQIPPGTLYPDNINITIQADNVNLDTHNVTVYFDNTTTGLHYFSQFDSNIASSTNQITFEVNIPSLSAGTFRVISSETDSANGSTESQTWFTIALPEIQSILCDVGIGFQTCSGFTEGDTLEQVRSTCTNGLLSTFDLTQGGVDVFTLGLGTKAGDVYTYNNADHVMNTSSYNLSSSCSNLLGSSTSAVLFTPSASSTASETESEEQISIFTTAAAAILPIIIIIGILIALIKSKGRRI